MNRVQGAHRFHRKRTSCALNNVQTNTIRMPASGGGMEVRPATRSRGFVDLSKCDRMNKYAIRFDQHEVGREHEFRAPERLPDAAASHFTEQPRQDSARFSINVQWVPRSSSRSRVVRCRFSSRERFGYSVGSFGAPRVSCPLLASPMRPDGRPRSSGRCPGGTSSATTSPRSVTNTVSPDRTSRMYSLRRFFNSRSPTLFIATM